MSKHCLWCGEFLDFPSDMVCADCVIEESETVDVVPADYPVFGEPRQVWA